MITSVGVVTILVRNQEDALQFYTDKLGLEKFHDTPMEEAAGRWLTVRTREQPPFHISLQLPRPGQGHLVGNNPMWSFTTDNCQGDYETLRARGVSFLQPPTEEPWGIEAIFEDLYGNQFSLLQPTREVLI
jgi:catechol 2,3-dioxygenase-like lactoylglutathione lyase family enzyme